VENDRLSPAPEKTPEDIQAEMAQTRESLTCRVAALENQVVGSVRTAADTITGTVEAMRSLVSDAPGTMSEGVRHAADLMGERLSEALDISSRVRRHPWAAVGVSALLGGLAGWMVSRRPTSGPEPAANRVREPMLHVAAPAPESSHGVFDELVSMLGHKLREIAENAIDTAGEAVNRSMRNEVPKLVDAAAQRLTSEAA
jgi:ElaB/YqjD/DUF883 family membrane-anchored ribosome-binding protein